MMTSGLEIGANAVNALSILLAARNNFDTCDPEAVRGERRVSSG